MKASDFIVSYLKEQGIKDIFGYQGTMIAHFVDSVCKADGIENHMCYNEQGAAFAAVGLAKASGKTAVAYSTSGPGAINLMNGIADAYYDSAPVVFFTGQLNEYEYTGISELRQQGFQETDVVDMVKPITKYATHISKVEDLKYELEKAFYIANEGRKGPVVLDIPMNVQREDLDLEKAKSFTPPKDKVIINYEMVATQIIDEIIKAEKPMLLLGNGIVKGSDFHKDVLKLVKELNIPIITSLPGRHLLKVDDELNFGYIGAAYGHRYANILAYKKADLIVSLACSFCKRQTGGKSENFAKNAKIIRVDIDRNELLRKVHSDETHYCCDCEKLVKAMLKVLKDKKVDKTSWVETCKKVKEPLVDFDNHSKEREPNKFIDLISNYATDDTVVCCDVGQHQIWMAQSFKITDNQRLLFSGGHGAMGFALPAAIGAYYLNKKPTVAVCGDGAFQMNIQELQWVKRENLPVTSIVLNNESLGLIQQQQDDFFDGNHFGSTAEGGYDAPVFKNIGEAYGINSYSVNSIEELEETLKTIDKTKPNLIEVHLDIKSKAYPKTYFGEEMYNQKPYIDKELMEEILAY
ncbi:MAG: thiamine pyrophosphate-binding protein [Ruminococcus sp.]|nr:thiamine pyrophosphate-binding protein [Ruminococcus sp.]MCI5598307.1 thiamine pyrophosphate-binding protein [Ruminococcus sp.]MCI6504847.1 thiamine pyrophosphate-binding protein [Ruminococcus sp.]